MLSLSKKRANARDVVLARLSVQPAVYHLLMMMKGLLIQQILHALIAGSAMMSPSVKSNSPTEASFKQFGVAARHVDHTV